MKKFQWIWLLLIAVTVLVFTGANIMVWNRKTTESGRAYRVEINRICRELEEGANAAALEEYPMIKGIIKLPEDATAQQQKAFFQGENTDYVIRSINGNYYRIEYQNSREMIDMTMVLIMNLGLGIMAVTMFGITGYLRHSLIKPFQGISELPYELSKGNLTVGLKENKNRFFGKFIWGLDLLRETLEENRKKELKAAAGEADLDSVYFP